MYVRASQEVGQDGLMEQLHVTFTQTAILRHLYGKRERKEGILL